MNPALDIIVPNLPIVWTTSAGVKPRMRWIGRITQIHEDGRLTCVGVPFDVDGVAAKDFKSTTHTVPVENIYALKIPTDPVRALLETNALADLLGDTKTGG